MKVYLAGPMRGIPDTEVSEPFVQGMKNRMAASYFKYGPVADGYPRKVDAIASLRRYLERYEETGNAEFLMDVANFAMIEFMLPRHPNAHFRPTDSGESPGRVGHYGPTQSPNKDMVEL